MAQLIIGKGVVWGVGGISTLKTGTTQTAANSASAQAVTITGFSLTKSRSLDEIADANGDIVAAVFHGQSDEASVECFPSAASVANAKTANALPAVGSVLQIVTSGSTEFSDLAPSATGYWSITGVTQNASNSSRTSWTLSLKRWGGISDVSQL